MPRLIKLLLLILLAVKGADADIEAAKEKAQAAREHANQMRMKDSQQRLERREAKEKEKLAGQRQLKEKQEAAARLSKETANMAKLCEEQKEKAMKSWRDSEINRKIDEEMKIQEVLTTPQNQMVLRNLFQPPLLNGPGFIRAGMIPNDLKQMLTGHLKRYSSRSFAEAFNPLLGKERKTKMLPLPLEWTKQGGYMDNSLRPLLEKLAGRKMQLVRFHPGLRIYQAGSTLMRHVDSPDEPVTVAILVSTTGEGATWHLELGEKPRPMPLASGQMLAYEGARLAHQRRGELKSGEVAMVFAYYRPKDYVSDPVQGRVDHILATQKVPPRGGSARRSAKLQAEDFTGNVEEL